MCGIAGIVAFNENTAIERATLERMLACIRHRGPDATGIHQTPRAGLAHCRLAILDLDPRSDQPFTDGSGRWLIFNGEIYNYRELKQQLPGEWRTEGDTEVLLRAYDTWGPDCCDKLDGMFAFAVWDENAGTLFLARDRMGQKPLYLYQRDGVFAFASELSALRHVPGFDETIDRQALCTYLMLGYIPRGSIYRSVTKLPAGCWARIDANGSEIQSYWRPRGGEKLPDEQAIAATRRLVEQAVRRQLVADVPIGCFLSGGIDSSIIAAAMVRATGDAKRVKTFSIGFADPRYDETHYAAAVAQHLGTDHRQFTVHPDAAADLPRLAEVFGEPFADSSALATHYLARETRQHVKVALSGDGGDELFGGYERYRAMALAEQLSIVPPSLTQWAQHLPSTHPKDPLTRIKRFAAALHLPAEQRYLRYVSLFDIESLRQLLKLDLLDAIDEHPLPFNPTLGPVQAARLADWACYLPEDIFTKVDRAAMLHALEVRSPFTDPDLLTFAAALPVSQLLPGKRLLRAAYANDLPAWVFKRPKMGFALPIGQWFRTGLKPMLRETVLAANSFASTHFERAAVERLLQEHDANVADYSPRLYALLMLELWYVSSRKN